MAMFEKKVDQAREIGRLEALVEQLTKENSRLEAQVKRLQDAIFSKEAPTAYADFKAEERALEAEALLTPEEVEQRKDEAKTWRKLAISMEEPLWNDANEMTEMFLKGAGVPEPKSMHGNDES